MTMEREPGLVTVLAGIDACPSATPIATGVPSRSPVASRPTRRQSAGGRAESVELCTHLFLNHVLEAGVNGPEKIPLRKALAFHPHGLVACRGVVAFFLARQLPNDPVRTLNQSVCGFINLRAVIEYLQHLGKEPFRGVFAAIHLNEFFVSFSTDFIEAIGFRLSSVVFPEDGPSQRLAAVLGEETKRRSVLGG